jgi:broad specificity phosphatase PhoE
VTNERRQLATTFFLVRHAAHGLVGGILAGRMPDVHLDGMGAAQARSLGRRLSREDISAVHSSPRERAAETAQEIAAALGLEVTIEPEIDEIDVGEWTGRSFEELRSDPRWQAWNASRSTARTPSGESMADVQDRVMRYLNRHVRRGEGERIVSVSHGDVIKAALFGCLGLSFDRVHQIEISPAGLSTIIMGEWGSKVHSVNEEVRL